MEKINKAYQAPTAPIQYADPVTNPHSKTRRIGSLGVRFFGSALLVWVLIRHTGVQWHAVMSSWSNISFWSWMIIAVGFVAMMSVKAARWRYIITVSGAHYPLLFCISSYLSGFAIGTITPGRLGEFSRAAFLQNNSGLSWRRSIGTVLTDRIFDLLFLSAFGTTGLVVFLFPTFRFFWPVSVLAVLAIGILIGRYLATVLKWLPKSLQQNRMFVFSREVSASMISSWPYALLLSSVGYAVYFALSQYIFSLAGVTLSLLDTSFLISGVGLLLLLPISIAGIGSREAAIVFVLGHIGYTPEIAIGASILHFACMFGIGGIIGAIMLVAAKGRTPRVPSQQYPDSASTTNHQGKQSKSA